MFRSLIEFSVRPGEEAAFVAAFHEAGMLTRPRAVPGFVRAELLRLAGGGADFVVIGEWETPEAYADWQARSRIDAPREALRRMNRCLVGLREGRLFEAPPGSK